MTDLDALHRAILDHPDDDTLRLIYADALEDDGESRRAAFIRAQVELARLPELLGTRVEADAALVLDWSSWWALETDSHPATDLRQQEANATHYRPLWESRITTDVVHPSSDLSFYRMVVVPNLYLVDEETAANLVSYVRAGGHLVMSFFSGIVACGMQSAPMTSIEELTGNAPRLTEVAERVVLHFSEVFGRTPLPLHADEIRALAVETDVTAGKTS